jgi:hypothetical protein
MEWRKRSILGNESLLLQMIAHFFFRETRINVFSAADAFESVMRSREWESFLFQEEESKR